MTQNRITPSPVVVTVSLNDAHTAPLWPGACASARVHATARVRGGGAARMEGH